MVSALTGPEILALAAWADCSCHGMRPVMLWSSDAMALMAGLTTVRDYARSQIVSARALPHINRGSVQSTYSASLEHR